MIVVYPGVTLLDAAGPAQVFSSANEVPGSPNEARGGIALCWHRRKAARSRPIPGLRSVPCLCARRQQRRAIDTLIVAGGVGVFDALEAKNLIGWIASCHKESRRVATTCMGAFLAAEARLLDRPDGHHPLETYRGAARTVIRMSGSSAIRFLSAMGRCGPLPALRQASISRLPWSKRITVIGWPCRWRNRSSYFLKRPGGQSQFSNVLAAQKDDRRRHLLGPACLGGGKSPERPGASRHWLRRAGMSPRTFARLYKERDWPHAGEVRRDDACRRGQTSAGANGNGARKNRSAQSGLVDEQRMRRAFLRHVGVSPLRVPQDIWNTIRVRVMPASARLRQSWPIAPERSDLSARSTVPQRCGASVGTSCDAVRKF